jgi:hypothetical protein
VKEFEGRAPEILEKAEEFKVYIPEEKDSATATALEHFQAHGKWPQPINTCARGNRHPVRYS